MKRSKKTELMVQAIGDDFNVELVAEDESWLLFVSERKDFFHFVEYDIEEQILSQHHVPHLAFARALERAAVEGDESVIPVQEGVGILPGEESFLMLGDGAVPFSVLGEGLSQRLLKTAKALAAARKKVVFEEGAYTIPEAATSEGNAVLSASKALIEGIAMERSLRRRLNAQDFGLYSAFCTHVDSPCALDEISCLKDLLGSHFAFYEDDFSDSGMVDAAAEVQRQLFPYPIWGPDIAVNAASRTKALKAAVKRLTPAQATQVVLLNGMHEANVFVALGVATGIISYEWYKELQTVSFEPDSEEEQFVRISASFIELFGAVTEQKA